jgi:hypothetical protein
MQTTSNDSTPALRSSPKHQAFRSAPPKSGSRVVGLRLGRHRRSFALPRTILMSCGKRLREARAQTPCISIEADVPKVAPFVPLLCRNNTPSRAKPTGTLWLGVALPMPGAVPRTWLRCVVGVALRAGLFSGHGLAPAACTFATSAARTPAYLITACRTGGLALSMPREQRQKYLVE